MSFRNPWPNHQNATLLCVYVCVCVCVCLITIIAVVHKVKPNRTLPEPCERAFLSVKSRFHRNSEVLPNASIIRTSLSLFGRCFTQTVHPLLVNKPSLCIIGALFISVVSFPACYLIISMCCGQFGVYDEWICGWLLRAKLETIRSVFAR